MMDGGQQGEWRHVVPAGVSVGATDPRRRPPNAKMMIDVQTTVVFTAISNIKQTFTDFAIHPPPGPRAF